MRRRGELHRRRAQQEIGRAGQQREDRARRAAARPPNPHSTPPQHQPGESGAPQNQVGDREAIRQAMPGGDEVAARRRHGEHAGGDGQAVGIGLVGHRPQHAGGGVVVLGLADGDSARSFVHLHAHSAYSLSEGAIKAEKLPRWRRMQACRRWR